MSFILPVTWARKASKELRWILVNYIATVNTVTARPGDYNETCMTTAGIAWLHKDLAITRVYENRYSKTTAVRLTCLQQ